MLCPHTHTHIHIHRLTTAIKKIYQSQPVAAPCSISISKEVCMNGSAKLDHRNSKDSLKRRVNISLLAFDNDFNYCSIKVLIYYIHITYFIYT